ncbi:MAG: helix-turn-helix transcriptional regulator [Lachnospiraceae bacterium]|nr:helix-turn-helix transcriptional regulator [Lachnospiraceae bacterium]
MTNDRLETGRRIRDFRIKNHLTQAQLAESLDVSTNFVSEIETGKKGISQDTLYRLCRQYNLSADYLLFGRQGPAPSEYTLSEFLASLSAEDIPIVIEYLEATLKIKKLDKKRSPNP